MNRNVWIIIVCSILLYTIDLLTIVALLRHLSMYGSDGHATGIIFFGVFLRLMTMYGEKANAGLRDDMLALSVAMHLIVVAMATVAGMVVYLFY